MVEQEAQMDIDKENTSPPRSAGLTKKASPPSSSSDVQAFSPELLRIYYSRLFPYDQMYKWLSYGGVPAGSGEADPGFFLRREISFTIEDDIYIRYQCFRDKEDMEAQIQKKQPYKIDLGAVFTVPPKDHITVKQGAFRPVERELVFDIDLTDYDDIRTCCQGANICKRCWSYMVMAMRVLDAGLRQDFGFRHVLWVYSGRRGVHCWVADDEARSLSNEARSAVAEYFSVVAGNDNKDKKVNVGWPVHPALERAYQTLEPLFRQHIIAKEGQALLAKQEHWGKLLRGIPYEGLADELEDGWKGDRSSEEEKWAEAVDKVEACAQQSSKEQRKAKKPRAGEAASPCQWKYEAVFTHCYPRLDVNVSKTQNHLLKSPFCAHPKTGRVCVPIDVSDCESFDPFAVPTLGQLAAELDQYDKQHGPELAKSTPYLDKTSLRAYVAFFESSFLKPLYQSIKRKMREEKERMSAVTLDF